MDIEIEETEGLDLLDGSRISSDEEVSLSNLYNTDHFVALGTDIETIVRTEKF